jgi:hypothetical protein
VSAKRTVQILKTKDTMTFIWQRLRILVIATAAIVTVAAAVAVVGRPQAVSDPRLGAEWQCSRTAFLITTCSQSSEAIKQRATAIGASHANVTRPSS